MTQQTEPAIQMQAQEPYGQKMRGREGSETYSFGDLKEIQEKEKRGKQGKGGKKSKNQQNTSNE